MGYELNKLMKQYGVATPGMVAYTGPMAPSVPTAPAALGKDASDEEKAAYEKSKSEFDAYQKDPAAFNEMMRKYGLAQKEFNQYRDAYQGRLSATPMYSDKQFYTGPSTGMKAATAADGIGTEKYNQNIQDFLAKNPSPVELQNAMNKYGVSGYDVAQARGTPGSMWGDKPVNSPTYGAVPVSLAGKSADEKAEYYKRLRDIGYTDADIRGSTAKNFGAINEGDWRNLLNRVYPDYQKQIEAGYNTLGRYGYGSNVTNIDDPGYNYWLNQLSTGAVKPGDLNAAMYNAANTWMPNLSYDVSKVPSGFDWGYYVSKYPDLAKAGIDTQFEAVRHFYNYGMNEGRSPYEGYVPPTTVTTPTTPTGNTILGVTGNTTGTTTGNTTGTTTGNTTGTNQTTPLYYDEFGTPIYGGGREVYNDSVSLYAQGGAVRKFQVGGNEGEPEDAIEALIRERGGVPATTSPVTPQPVLQSRDITAADAAPVLARSASAAQPVTTSPAAQPVTPPPAASTPMSPAATDLMSMMNRYLSAESMYGPELKAARERVTAENEAFQKMIANAMKPDAGPVDKTEMYFRLAAAFGAPSKTGHFTENLSMVGKELGEYAKEQRATKRAERQLGLQLGIEAQKLKAQAARDELTTLRTLAGEEMKDKRSILQEYIKSGMPQSEAGKAAMDAGLTKGTPEFNNFVNKYIDDKIRSGNLLKEAMVAIAAGNLAVAQGRERRAEESGKKLTPSEVKLKAEAEDSLGSIDDAMGSLKRAYSLNPNTFDGTLVSIAQRKVLEQTDPKDPRVLATREQQNLLSKGAISNLRTAFGGNPTEGERKALLDLEGIDAKSKEERGLIMRNTYKLLQQRRAREQKRLNDITAGLYRETTPSAGEID